MRKNWDVEESQKERGSYRSDALRDWARIPAYCMYVVFGIMNILLLFMYICTVHIGICATYFNMYTCVQAHTYTCAHHSQNTHTSLTQRIETHEHSHPYTHIHELQHRYVGYSIYGYNLRIKRPVNILLFGVWNMIILSLEHGCLEFGNGCDTSWCSDNCVYSLLLMLWKGCWQSNPKHLIARWYMQPCSHPLQPYILQAHTSWYSLGATIYLATVSYSMLYNLIATC